MKHEKETDSIINVDDYSLASYFVDVMRNEIKLCKGTCFFTKVYEKLYLVTNWHIVTGKNADTNKSLTDTCAIPNKLRVYLPSVIKDEGVKYDAEKYLEVPLYDKDDNKLWLDKKVNNRMIDVALIPCGDIKDLFYIPIEEAEEPFNEGVKCFIASDIFIIGFPFGDDYGYTPIWKKASVASEPEIDVEGLPYFFADTATKEGMSGSPVILYKDRVAKIFDKERGASFHKTKFVGIYSGRIGANSDVRNDAQLGRIWKAKVIQEIVDENLIEED